MDLDEAELAYFQKLSQIRKTDDLEVNNDERITIIEESLRKLQLQVDMILQAPALFAVGSPTSPQAPEIVACIESEVEEKLEKRFSEELEELKVELDEIKEMELTKSEKTAETDIGATRHSRVEMFQDEDSEYTFEESVWDLAMFIGMPELGRMGSIVTCGLYVLNLLVQLVFCIVCNVSLVRSAEKFNDEALRGVQEFRASVGHNHRFFDTIQGTSLEHRICNNEIDNDFKTASAVQSNYQISLIGLVEDYLAPGGEGVLEKTFAGRMLVAIALLCWFLVTTREIRDVYQAFCAIINIKVGERTKLKTEAKQNQKDIRIWFFAKGRRICICFILMQRAAVSVVLLIAGGRWLARTSSIEELLLNVAALNVVFEVDELLYHTLATDPNKALISRLIPLAQKRQCMFYGLDMPTAVCWLIVPSLVLLFYFLHAAPMIDRMYSAYDYLCAQDQHWTYGVDNVFGVLWTQTNTQHSDEGNFTGAVERMRAVTHSDVVARIQSKAPQGELKITDTAIGSLSELSAMTFESMLSELNPFCSDILQNHGAFLQWIQVVSNNHNIRSCMDVKAAGLCDATGLHQFNRAARLLCNKACECDNPAGEVYSHKEWYGCGPRCTENFAYKNAVNNLGFTKSLITHPDGDYEACDDLVASTLTQQQFWHGLANGLKAHGTKYSLANQIATNMSTQGCGFLEAIRNLPSASCGEIGYTCPALVAGICTGTSILDMRAVSPFCAMSCGCHLVVELSCALDCQNNFYWDFASSPSPSPSPSPSSP